MNSEKYVVFAGGHLLPADNEQLQMAVERYADTNVGQVAGASLSQRDLGWPRPSHDSL